MRSAQKNRFKQCFLRMICYNIFFVEDCLKRFTTELRRPFVVIKINN